MRQERNEAAQTSSAWRVRTHCSYGKKEDGGWKNVHDPDGTVQPLGQAAFASKGGGGCEFHGGGSTGHMELEQIGPEKTVGSRQSCCTG